MKKENNLPKTKRKTTSSVSGLQPQHFINCHTHIFTIHHVPQHFGRTIVPRIVTLNLVQKIYTFVQKNKTPDRLYNYLLRFDGKIQAVLKFLGIKWLYNLLKQLLKWGFTIVANFFVIDKFLSKNARELLNRYLNLARNAYYNSSRDDMFGGQDFILKNLMSYYPPLTRFVVLPMDMDYMEAGKPDENYETQLEQLRLLKRSSLYGPFILPFVFADPRRIEQNPSYLDKTIHLLKEDGFAGIKIYPALGYFPFDKNLLDLFEFACKNDVPVMTHCIKGVVYYRGVIKEEWKKHSILKQNLEGPALELEGDNPSSFSANFTHPLNYECLLNPDLLNRFSDGKKKYNLSGLKICLAHFGGEDEWQRYLKDGWGDFGKSNLKNRKDPMTLRGTDNIQVWKAVSWLTIVYDIMCQYKNVYADISYILHDASLMPTLKDLLSVDSPIQDRILFGTDYYVVSKEGTEKELYSDVRFHLGDKLFHKIAVENPERFLKSKFNP